MSEFSVICNNCKGEVNSFIQQLEYILTPTASIQQGQTMTLSCGCVIDFPDWKINLDTGWCELTDYAGHSFIKFLDEELIVEEE